MSLYVYCLGEELSEAAFERVAGVGGARVRVLELGRVTAVVSETEDDSPPVTDENVLAHNRVNAAALAVSTPLPCRFGTRAAPERLAEYAASNEAALLATLARVRGCVEMSVKILGQSEVGSRRSEVGSQKLEGEGAGRGTAFLLKKRRELLGEEDVRAGAEESGAWLAAGVAAFVRETAARVNPSEAIVVRAAHLVERGRVAEYKARLRALAAGRAELRLLTSGPWPPYSFSDIRGTLNAEM